MQHTVSESFSRSYFNSAALPEYSPFKIEEGKGIWCPKERMEYVEGYLRRKAIPLVLTDNNYHFIPSDNPRKLLKCIKLQQQEIFNYEYWYCKMKGITNVVDETGENYDPLANAFILPLNTEQIKELMILTKKKAIKTNVVTNTDFSEEEQIIYNKYVTLFDNQLKMLNEIKNKLGEFEGNVKEDILQNIQNVDLAEHEFFQDGYFIRLSGRSPKDFVTQLLNSSTCGDDIVKRLILSTRSLCCMKEFLKSDDPSKSIAIIFIPWDNNLNSSLEFRCFVHKKKLTAISQYDCYHSFPMFANENFCFFIKEKIENFYDQIKAFIPYHSCILDVMLKPKYDTKGDLKFEVDVKEDRPDWRVHLLEFNPFFADVSSGAGLFEWGQDFEVLHNGAPNNTSVLRVRIKPKGTKTRIDRPDKPTIVDII